MEKGRCCDCESNNDGPNTIKYKAITKIAVNFTLDLYPVLTSFLSNNTLCHIVLKDLIIIMVKLLNKANQCMLP